MTPALSVETQKNFRALRDFERSVAWDCKVAAAKVRLAMPDAPITSGWFVARFHEVLAAMLGVDVRAVRRLSPPLPDDVMLGALARQDARKGLRIPRV